MKAERLEERRQQASLSVRKQISSLACLTLHIEGRLDLHAINQPKYVCVLYYSKYVTRYYLDYKHHLHYTSHGHTFSPYRTDYSKIYNIAQAFESYSSLRNLDTSSQPEVIYKSIAIYLALQCTNSCPRNFCS